jgi:hypothetical protein
MEQLVGLGIGWVWMGIEGKDSQYRKLEDVDTRKLVKRLQSHGIRVLGSSIIGLENHKPETMDQIISHAVGHQADFHQFMLYTPVPGTPLYEAHQKNKTLLSKTEFHPADAHGQYSFNYRHANIEPGQEEGFLLQAFEQDFQENGPSLARLIRTLLIGWQRYKNSPDKRIRERYAREVRPLRSTYAGAVWAMKRYYRNSPLLFSKMKALLSDIHSEFGLIPRIASPLIGIFAYFLLLQEETRLTKNWSYEPTTFYEKNSKAEAVQCRRNQIFQKTQKTIANPLASPKPFMKYK